LKPGDLVIPALPGLGTWQTYGVYPETAWMKVVNTLPLKMAASLLVNPFTAYRMLEDFVPLKDGLYSCGSLCVFDLL
jgi:trans-2-enoyl-CoA reductase